FDAGKAIGPQVQTKADDRSVFVTDDGKYPQYIFFGTTKDDDAGNFDIYVSLRDGPGKVFGPSKGVNAICTEADENHPWLSPDKLTIYFSRKDKDGWHVYTAHRKTSDGGQGWDDPAVIKELPAGYHHATVSGDGKTMYLQGPMGKGRWGLFVAQKGTK